MEQKVWIDISYSKPPIDEKVKIKISDTCIFFAIYKGNNVLEFKEGSNPIHLNMVKDFDIEAVKNMQWCEI
jgi:hypothetical protein